MKTRIIVDSTADMRPEVAEKVGIVPLTVHFGDQEYISGVNIHPMKFYEMLVESDVLPTTSQAGPFAFEEAFAEAVRLSVAEGLARNEEAREVLWLLPDTKARKALAEMTYRLDDLLRDCCVED